MNKLSNITKLELEELLNHLNQRHSICDLVDDKSQEEISEIKEIWKLCENICFRLEEIYKNP